VYYSKFAFEPADFSITLVFLFTFIGIAIVALLLWVMARNKLLDGCQRITFFKNVLGEFDSNEVGDGLVLQVLDYKKTQKRKERSRMTNLSADDSGQQLDTSTVSNNEQM
jgi:hypothetical protein